MEIDEENQEFNNPKRRSRKKRRYNKAIDYINEIQKNILNYFKVFFVITIIFLLSFFLFFIPKLLYKNINNNSNNNNQTSLNPLSLEDMGKIESKDLIIDNNLTQKKLNLNGKINITINAPEKNGTNKNTKLGIAFVYSTLFSNGIARFITVTAENFLKTEKYDIYFITGKPYSKEFKYSSKIKRFIGHNNATIIKNITKHYKIDFFLLQNVLGSSTIKWYKSLGSKIIGMFHGNYMSAMFLNDPMVYKQWYQFDLFDAYVFITSDDYYFYNNLNFKNHIFIPNLYTFEPSKFKNSNLTYHNIMMLGRQNDVIKGAIYAVKAMSLIIKKVSDAQLNIITSDSRIQFLKNLTKDLNLTKCVKFIYHTYDISSYFYNSSIFLFPSLSEAFPMAMNEGKAHGMPIVAFDVPISPPYQDGVITVDSMDYIALARECVNLLKDYDYRKKMGEWSKLSLNKFSNEETVEIWGKLFQVLNQGEEQFRKFQKEILNKFYDEKSAKLHIEKHFRDVQKFNKNFSCYTLENFSNPYYVKNIKTCMELNATSNATVNNVDKK